MDESSSPQSLGQVPTSFVSGKKHTIWKWMIGVIGIALVSGGVAWLYIQQTQKAPVPQMSTSSDWQVYTNTEIGISFEYPIQWGEVTISKETSGCYSTNVEYYYGAAKFAQMKKDVAAAPEDPCQSVRIMIGGVVIAQTQTPLAVTYPIGRDGYWGDISGSIKNETYIRSFCDTEHGLENCTVTTNKQGIVFARYFGNLSMGEQMGDIYAMHTRHPLYYGLALSPAWLPVAYQKDFPRLIDSLRFLPARSKEYLLLIDSAGAGLTEDKMSVIKDPWTFTSAGYYMKTAGEFYKDKQAVYLVVEAEPVYGLSSSVRIVPDADPATIRGIDLGLDGEMFAVDKSHVYCFAFPLPGVNPYTAKFSKKEYVIDQGHVWGRKQEVQLHQVPSMTLTEACHEYTRSDFESDQQYAAFLAEIER